MRITNLISFLFFHIHYTQPACYEPLKRVIFTKNSPSTPYLHHSFSYLLIHTISFAKNTQKNPPNWRAFTSLYSIFHMS